MNTRSSYALAILPVKFNAYVASNDSAKVSRAISTIARECARRCAGEARDALQRGNRAMAASYASMARTEVERAERFASRAAALEARGAL